MMLPITEGSTTSASSIGDDGALEGLPLLLTVDRVAGLLGISRASAYRYASSGILPSTRLGGRIYVITAELLALVSQA
jgi:excisionase family DNA binding protein